MFEQYIRKAYWEDTYWEDYYKCKNMNEIDNLVHRDDSLWAIETFEQCFDKVNISYEDLFNLIVKENGEKNVFDYLEDMNIILQTDLNDDRLYHITWKLLNEFYFNDKYNDEIVFVYEDILMAKLEEMACKRGENKNWKHW